MLPLHLCQFWQPNVSYQMSHQIWHFGWRVLNSLFFFFYQCHCLMAFDVSARDALNLVEHLTQTVQSEVTWPTHKRRESTIHGTRAVQSMCSSPSTCSGICHGKWSPAPYLLHLMYWQYDREVSNFAYIFCTEGNPEILPSHVELLVPQKRKRGFLFHDSTPMHPKISI